MILLPNLRQRWSGNKKMSFEEKTVFEQKYIVPSWGQMGELCFDLAKKVIESKERFERIVALAKSGWTWARTFSDYTKIGNLSSLQLEYYKGVYETLEAPVITQALPVDVKGESILLFDDVSDSGKTLLEAKKHLLSLGAKSVMAATLFMKPWTEYVPEFFGEKTDAWIIFPHEIRETTELLSNNWKKKGVGADEIKERLIKIGISKGEVEYFLKNWKNVR